MLSNIAGPSLNDLRTYDRVTIKTCQSRSISSKIKKKKTFYKGTGNKQKDKLQKVILKKLNIIINKRMFKKFFFKK